jgi:hypothetical protein
MNELTDLEICQRIAEIEGKSYWDNGTGEGLCINYIDGNRASKVLHYNPLTDDALWVQLIDKHNVSINTHFWNPSVKQCYIIRQVEFEMITGKTFSVSAFGLKKAACLAIIESKE